MKLSTGKAWLYILIVLSVVIAVQQYFLGPKNFWNGNYTHYNNFVIFRNSFWHLISGKNLYSYYPGEYGDLYKYSPTFALFMGLFYYLPDLCGLILWNVLNISLLYFSLRSLQWKDYRQISYVFFFILMELVLSTQNSQSNAMIAALTLLACGSMEKGRHGSAGLFLALGFFIKVYSVVTCLFILLYPGRWRTLCFTALYFLFLLLLPLFVISPHELFTQYQNWYALIRSDTSVSSGMSIFAFTAIIGDAPWIKVLALTAGGSILLLTFYSALKQRDYGSRLNMLTMILLFMVLFNPKAESPTFVIVMTGIALWMFNDGLTPEKKLLGILALFFTSVWFTDLVPPVVRKSISPDLVKPFVPLVIYFFIGLKIPHTKRVQLH